jgi:hypothetical protein
MGRLAGCAVEGGCMFGSRLPETELCIGPAPEGLPEAPCLETEPAKGLLLYDGPADMAGCCLVAWLRALDDEAGVL